MKSIILSISLLFALSGCGEDGRDSNTTEVLRTEITIPNDSYVTLENNQSIGYKPNTDVTIINVGDGAYYIYCGDGECPVNIDNSTDSSTSSADIQTITEDNSNVSTTQESEA